MAKKHRAFKTTLRSLFSVPDPQIETGANKSGLLDYRGAIEFALSLTGASSAIDLEENFSTPSVYIGKNWFKYKGEIVPADELKIGQDKHITALIRGRNQGGASFRIYGLVLLENEDDRFKLETGFKQRFVKYIIPGLDAQSELYNFKENQIAWIIQELIELAQDLNIPVKKVFTWSV